MTAPANITPPADYARAVATVQEHGKTAVSWLQRQMGIGYNAAAKMIEQMESDGIVSAPNHVGKRDLLSSKAPAPSVAEEQMTIPVDLPEAHRAPDDKLRLLIERIERLMEEKKAIADDIREVFGETKANGYDVRMTREMIRLRKMRADDRREMEALMETYRAALGLD